MQTISMFKTLAKLLQEMRKKRLTISLTMKKCRYSPNFKKKREYEWKRKKNRNWSKRKPILEWSWSLNLNRTVSNTKRSWNSKYNKSLMLNRYRTICINKFLMESSVRVSKKFMHLKWKSCGLLRCGYKGDGTLRYARELRSWNRTGKSGKTTDSFRLLSKWLQSFSKSNKPFRSRSPLKSKQCWL